MTDLDRFLAEATILLLLNLVFSTVFFNISDGDLFNPVQSILADLAKFSFITSDLFFSES